MQQSFTTLVLAGLVSLVSAKGGGGKGGGGGGSGGTSSTSTYFCPTCRSDLPSMYGHTYTSVFTGVEVIAMASITAFFLLVLIGFNFRLKRLSAWTTRLATWSLMLGLVFWIVRYILLIVGLVLPVGMRNESSIALLFWRLGFTILLVAISMEINLGKLVSIANIILQAILAIFNLTYVIMDFTITQQAIAHYRAGKGWLLSDRDFGLTFSKGNIHYLAMSKAAVPNGLTADKIKESMYDPTATKLLHDRGVQITIGLIVDLLAFAVAILLVTMATLRLVKRKAAFVKCPIYLLVATGGLLLTTAFRVIITGYFVLHNWGVVTNAKEWDAWSKVYQMFDVKTMAIPPTTFLAGYRIAITGFPIIRAVIEPLGIVIACGALVSALVKLNYKAVNSEEAKV